MSVILIAVGSALQRVCQQAPAFFLFAARGDLLSQIFHREDDRGGGHQQSPRPMAQTVNGSPGKYTERGCPLCSSRASTKPAGW